MPISASTDWIYAAAEAWSAAEGPGACDANTIWSHPTSSLLYPLYLQSVAPQRRGRHLADGASDQGQPATQPTPIPSTKKKKNLSSTKPSFLMNNDLF